MDDPIEQFWRILMVDDDEDDYLITRAMLHELPGRKAMLDWAPDYAEGQARMQAQEYSVVMVDYDLGPRSGIELIREMVQRNYPAPLVLYTNRGSYEADIESMEAGATLYLIKGEATPLLLERSLRYAIERKGIERELDRRLQERSELVESISDGFLAVDHRWQITFINHRAAETTGLQPADLAGRNLWEVFPRLYGTEIEKYYRQAMQERAPAQFEAAGIYSQQYYNVNIYPSSEGLSIFWQDISWRKQADDALRESEQKFALLFQKAAFSAALSRLPDGVLVDVNEAWVQTFGYSREEAIGKTTLELNINPQADARAQTLSQLQEQGSVRNLERMLRTRDGAWRRFAINIDFIELNGNRYLLNTAQDITERYQAEEARRATEKRFRSMFENHRAMMMLIEPDTGAILQANAAAAAFYGYSIERLQTMSIDQINLLSQEEVAERRRKAVNLEKNDFVFPHRLANGETHWVEVYTTPISMWERPILFSIIHDITERKRAEQALLAYNQRLEESNQALEDFAFIASHDLQEPLRKIEAFGSILQNSYSDTLDATGQDYINRMKNTAHRMRDMLDGLMAYARVTSQGRPFVAVDLEQVIHEVLLDLEARLMQTNGQVEVGPMPVIEADPLQIRLLLQNLIGNALKFHHPDTPPRVRVSCRPDRENLVLLEVSDNGIGFDNKEANYLFKPFHRLHNRSQYEGAGLGLAICHKIVTRHGGEIQVESHPDQGSTFRVRLPVRASP